MTTKKRGRPKGAKTKSRPVVEEKPAQCPKCGSTTRTAKKTALSMGKPSAEAGQWFKTVYSRVDCRQCGQHYAIRTKYCLGTCKGPDDKPPAFDPIGDAPAPPEPIDPPPGDDAEL